MFVVAVKLNVPLAPMKDAKTIGAELEQLAECLGTELSSKVSLGNAGDEPIMQGQIQGFSFAVRLLSHNVGWLGFSRVPSISLILNLSEHNKYRFEKHNSEGMSLIFHIPAKPKHLDEGILLDPSQVDEVLPEELREFLAESDLDYFFNIQQDRIVMSVYRAYQQELYLFLLEQMAKTAQALAALA